MSGGEVMFHYTLSTCHTEKTPRSDVRLEMLAALRSTVEVAIGGKAVPLPGFPITRSASGTSGPARWAGLSREPSGASWFVA